MNERFDLTPPEHLSLRSLTRAPMSIVLTNPRLEDNPIVYVNEAFEKVTGFAREAVIGRNCRFLQGDDTREPVIDELRRAIAEGEEVTVDVMNYRADGEPFLNRLMIAPLRDGDGEIIFFMGVQMARSPDHKDEDQVKREEVEHVLRELQHRVKNHLAMIVGMIRLQSRQASPYDNFGTLSRRVEALQMIYEEMGDLEEAGANQAEVALGAYITRVANAIAHLDGRQGVRVNIDSDSVHVPFEIATRIGLCVSEVMTNALQHAFEGREAGIVEVRLKELSGGKIRVSITDDGIGLPEDTKWPEEGNLGSRIVRDLLSDLDAALSVQRNTQGTTVAFDVPLEKD